MAADYHYISTWQLQAPIERVWAAISQLEQLPAWYPAVQQVQTLTAGDPDGVGSRVRYLLKGRLPMQLAFEATIARVNPPRELELQAEGDLAGTERIRSVRNGGSSHRAPTPMSVAPAPCVTAAGRSRDSRASAQAERGRQRSRVAPPAAVNGTP
jgi:hypothetical protein